MRIATFNLESLDLPLGTRPAVLRPALERLEADILCLQEVNGQHVPGTPGRRLAALDALIEGTSYAGFHRAWTRTAKGAADVHNLVTLSRTPILETRQILHDIVPPARVGLVTADPPEPEPVAVRFERPVLVTAHGLGRERLWVANLHLRAGLASAIPGGKTAPFAWASVAAWAEGFWLSGLKRSGQALELRLAVEALLDADPSAPILLAGDFNAEDHETPLRILMAAPEDTGTAPLAGRGLVVLDRAIDPGRRFSVLHQGRPQMLDHLLASHALYGRFRGIEVHNEGLGDEAMGWARGVAPAGSYHAPLVAAFAFE